MGIPVRVVPTLRWDASVSTPVAVAPPCRPHPAPVAVVPLCRPYCKSEYQIAENHIAPPRECGNPAAPKHCGVSKGDTTASTIIVPTEIQESDFCRRISARFSQLLRRPIEPGCKPARPTYYASRYPTGRSRLLAAGRAACHDSHFSDVPHKTARSSSVFFRFSSQFQSSAAAPQRPPADRRR